MATRRSMGARRKEMRREIPEPRVQSPPKKGKPGGKQNVVPRTKPMMRSGYPVKMGD